MARYSDVPEDQARFPSVQSAKPMKRLSRATRIPRVVRGAAPSRPHGAPARPYTGGRNDDSEIRHDSPRLPGRDGGRAAGFGRRWLGGPLRWQEPDRLAPQREPEFLEGRRRPARRPGPPLAPLLHRAGERGRMFRNFELEVETPGAARSAIRASTSTPPTRRPASR